MSYDPKELQALQPAQLEQRRRDLRDEIAKLSINGTDLHLVPTEMLQELAFITGALRRRTAGPPKETKRTKRSTAPAATLDDIDAMLS